MRRARPDELRLALLAMVSAASDDPLRPQTCSDTMDLASLSAGLAPPEALAVAAATDPTRARLGAVNLLAGLCHNCGGCERAFIHAPRRLVV